MVDNHDSFVHTLVGYLTELGARVDIVEADEIDPDAASSAIAEYDGVVVSPGPGSPEHAGASVAVVRAAAAHRRPLLGVCLGHQAITVAFGGTVARAPELMHGMTSETSHDDSALFRGIPSPFTVGRYHSLAAVDTDLPAQLRVTARSEAGTIMAVSHVSLPIAGVQFHPESVLTDHGYRLLGNWLSELGDTDAAVRGAELSPHRGRVSPSTPSA
nr:gamma-glutamyl-gamma-aminobutyrate hydrolase family protein [Microbacterium sp. SORGH_AS_0888]